jgi:Mrp family chromosome partitioning ATPase
MAEVLTRMGQEADVCILDSPPVLAVTDAMVLASRVDQTVLVAESGRVTKHAFREMKRLIHNARGTILGVVINKMRPSSSEYYYYYYYYEAEDGEDGDGDNNR